MDCSGARATWVFADNAAVADRGCMMVPRDPGISLREVRVRSVLSPSKLADYCVNPYAGCEHGCVYCYARFATRFSHPGERWGSFVDVRVNAPLLLEREAARKRPGQVYISSVSDAWQPSEQVYRLTRRCLELLLRHGYSLFLQTKNALVLRDFDLLMGHRNVELGVTVTTLQPGVASLFEPGASSPGERLDVVKKARSIGLRTFVFLGPLLPGISDGAEGLRQLLEAVAEVAPDRVLVDCLNPRYGMWPAVSTAVSQYDPCLLALYRRILYDREERALYTHDLRRRVSDLATGYGLGTRMRCCF